MVLAFLVGCRGHEAAPAQIEEPDPTPRLVLPDESAYQASAEDGGGSVQVTPGSVRAGQPCTLTFTYTAGARGIRSGGGVLCYVSSFWYWTPPQSQSPEQPGYATVSCSNPGVDLEVETDPSSQTILARIAGGRLDAGDHLTFIYGDTSGDTFPQARGTADRFAEREERFYFKVDGDGDGWFTPVAQQPSFDVTSAPAVRLICYGPSLMAVGETSQVRISALDSARNLDESYTGKIRLDFDESLLQGPRTVLLDTGDRGSIGVPVQALAAGMAVIEASDAEQGLAAPSSNVIVIHDPGQQRYRLLWADLQVHGNLSDGTGTPEDIYRYARDVARLDIAALTEHDYWGYLPLAEQPQAWQRVLDGAATMHQPGRFITFPAYEWTSWTFGHQHILFAREQDAQILAWQDPNYDHPRELLAALAGIDCLAIPHHPGGGPVPYCWKYHDPDLQPVVEIVSVHGVSERVGAIAGIRQPVPSGMVQAALARGHRLGLIGGGDTHDGHPGIGSPGMPAPGLAAIYAEELTRPAVLDALRQRRVYASNGCRTILRFHSGPVAMGGVISAAALDGPLELEIALVAEAMIIELTIVKSNRDYAVIEDQGMVMALTWHDPEPAKPGDFYYLRVNQSDGGQVWSSPIWIDQ
jgi:hypothetical protein